MGEENKRLVELMREHQLSLKQVAELLYVAEQTVKSWRAPDDAIHYRNTPKAYIELLEIKLKRK
jgi:hypothetical protein